MLLKEHYGKQVIVNLLGSKGGEEVLSRAFKVKTKDKVPLHVLLAHEKVKEQVSSYQIPDI